MRRRTASVLLLSLAVAAPAAADDGPPELQALVRIGGPIGKDNETIKGIFWVDAGRHGHIAFLVSTATANELWEYRSSTEKPYKDRDSNGYGSVLLRADRTAKGVDTTVIARRGDPVAGSIKGSKLAEVDSDLYSSPSTWDGTAAFVAKLSTGREVLIVRRP